MLKQAKNCLKKFEDSDRMLTMLIALPALDQKNSISHNKINTTILLNQAINAALELKVILQDAESTLLIEIRNVILFLTRIYKFCVISLSRFSFILL